MRMSFLLAAALVVLGCTSEFRQQMEKEYPASLTLRLQNPAPVARMDEMVAVSLANVKAKAPTFNPLAMVLLQGDQEVPVQLQDEDGDGQADAILACVNFRAHETVKLRLRYAETGSKVREYKRRTQAELSVKTGGKWQGRKYEGGTFTNVASLRVPPEHTDHSWYIRYEGPGWESDKVGYRFYLDWRNATDIFGKLTPEMVLQNVGQDGFDSYHNPGPWGMDILKVGESLGIGSIAFWDGHKAERVAKTDSIISAITESGPVCSRITTTYYGWNLGAMSTRLISQLSITAGSRMTRQRLDMDADLPNLCTGLVKMPDTEVIPGTMEGEWTWLATWGLQSLNNDSLGIAVLYRRADEMQLTEDANSHVVVLRPENRGLHYYFLAAWEKEPGGIANKQGFVAYLLETVQRLNNPIKVIF